MARTKIKKITGIAGWILIAPDEDDDCKRTPGEWHVCWEDVFGTRRTALAFVKANNWHGTYRAVRGGVQAARS